MKSAIEPPRVGISIAFIRQFDPEREREESLKRAAADIRKWRFLTAPFAETEK